MTIHITKLHVPNMVQRVDGQRAEHDFSIDSLGDINILVGEDNYNLEETLYYLNAAVWAEETSHTTWSQSLFCSTEHYSQVPKKFAELLDYVKEGQQVFISTQSLDVIKFVMDRYGDLNMEPDLDIKFIRIGKSAKKGDDQKLISVIYGRERFAGLMRNGFEVR